MKLGFLAKVTEAVVECIFEKMLLSKNAQNFQKISPLVLQSTFLKLQAVVVNQDKQLLL